ncbi:carbohydrate kinase family protein [Methylomonas methanica]|uniref:PfkB domain protein n=1 Tax=Methylomonas methanica (strain DSM 25384 / MC09) TaxID=857087 RepID=F9ZZ42_METMM|nr:PfkB family carbohydrate kinase [Methylomonas methanica]AEG01068.1 PfkB domain protein [Methylomonas methanica MC09]
MPDTRTCLDVLCLGHASYDLVFSVPHHPAEDEKLFADGLLGCGGGPAANAAVAIARLGYQAAFAGYLGRDVYGDSHYAELQQAGVETDLIVRGDSPTPLSAILVKPNGKRALLNYKGDTKILPADALDFFGITAKTVLFDGHEPLLSLALLDKIGNAVPTVLDAGSLHTGTEALMAKVTYLVCSEKFALQYAGDPRTALSRLAALSPNVVITLGERGLIWQRGLETGNLPAPPIAAVDTTGAGDAFHGAFAAAVAAEMTWLDSLYFASAAGAFCCTRMGARPGLPDRVQHQQLLSSWRGPITD